MNQDTPTTPTTTPVITTTAVTQNLIGGGSIGSTSSVVPTAVEDHHQPAAVVHDYRNEYEYEKEIQWNNHISDSISTMPEYAPPLTTANHHNQDHDNDSSGRRVPGELAREFSGLMKQPQSPFQGEVIDLSEPPTARTRKNLEFDASAAGENNSNNNNNNNDDNDFLTSTIHKSNLAAAFMKKRFVWAGVGLLVVTILLITVTTRNNGSNNKNNSSNSSANNNPELGNPGMGDENDANGDDESYSKADIPIIMQDRTQFLHYTVQWGIQTHGCANVNWPQLQLSCGAGFDSVVEILGYELPDAYDSVYSTDAHQPKPEVQCDRIAQDLIHCELKHYRGVTHTSDNMMEETTVTSPTFLYATLLVVCAANPDENEEATKTGATNDISRQLDLRARVPDGHYATHCNQLLTQADKNDPDRVYGGFSMPWLSMGMTCLEEEQRRLVQQQNPRARITTGATTTLQEQVPQRQLRNPRMIRPTNGLPSSSSSSRSDSQIENHPPPRHRSVLATTQGMTDANFHNRLNIYSNIVVCDQGNRTVVSTAADANEQQEEQSSSFCVGPSHCTLPTVCSPTTDSASCPGEEKCFIPSPAVLADSFQLSINDGSNDITTDCIDSDKCVFSHVLPHDWMWDLAKLEFHSFAVPQLPTILPPSPSN